MIAPEWIAKIEVAWVGCSTDGRTGDTANDSAGTRTSRHRTNRGTCTGTEKSARHCAISRICAASGEDQGARHQRAHGKFLEEHYSLHAVHGTRR
jgi:hypothetical protein